MSRSPALARPAAIAPGGAALERPAGDPFADPRTIAGAGLALARANLRYWPSVAPLVRAELAQWRRRAGAIPDPRLRAMAVGKLQEERFNVEVAATLATAAPRTGRRRAVEAIVALQVMYDYLDVATEQPGADPEQGRRLFAALSDALALGEAPRSDYYGAAAGQAPDGGYLQTLVQTVRGALAALPSAGAVEQAARSCAARCAEAEVLTHAHAQGGTGELERWAREQAAGTALWWPELLAGAAASVIALHALIATAAHPDATAREAERLSSLYLSICALTMLDSLVDHRQDSESGAPHYLDFYGGDEELMARRLAEVARHAARAAGSLRAGRHHIATLVGIVAYYASSPQAAAPHARPVIARLRRELGPVLAPTLALMRAWRLAKRLRGGAHAAAEGRS